MQFKLFVPLAVALLTSSAALAEARHHVSTHDSAGNGAETFGLGLILGEPTGVTGKYFLRPDRAIDGGVAFSLDSFFLLYADYLFEFRGAFRSSDPFVSRLAPYVGIGGVFLASTANNRTDQRFFTSTGASTGLGLRIPLGIEWKPTNPPLGVFVEFVPGMGMIPSTFAFLEGGVGIRYYF